MSTVSPSPASSRGLIGRPFDVSALTVGMTPEQVAAVETARAQSVAGGSVRGKRRAVMPVLGVVIVVMVLGVFALFFSPWPQLSGTVVVIGVPAVFIVGIVQTTRTMRRKASTLPAFAAANGLAWIPAGAGLSFEELPLFTTGYGQHSSDLFTYAGPGPAVNVFNFSYKEDSGSGKSRTTTTYRFGIVAVNLGVEVPATALLSGRLRTLLGWDRLRLGAGVDEQVTAFVAAGKAERALYFFTPDVLAAVVDFAGGVDVYLTDRQLVLVVPEPFDAVKPDTWNRIAGWLGTVAVQVLEQADRARRSRTGRADVSGASPQA